MQQNMAYKTQQVLINHNLVKKDGLANLKSQSDKLGIDILLELYAYKLKPVPVDLKNIK